MTNERYRTMRLKTEHIDKITFNLINYIIIQSAKLINNQILRI